MTRTSVVLAAAMLILVGGCKPTATPAANDADAALVSPPASTKAAAPGRWGLLSSDEGVGLAFTADGGERAIHLFCPANGGRLLVNLPGVTAIGSEERLSFGGGGDVVALVADPAGDPLRGGVSGVGPVPAGLADMLRAGPAASYGATTLGPLPPLDPAVTTQFAAACRSAPPPPAPPPASASACRLQDGKAIDAKSLRAIGTEPFWGADIDGRCVTYSTPEDQSGTRLWTRFSSAGGGGATYVGALGGQSFRMDVRPQPGCSDGMSDRRYPLAVSLRIGGDIRHGCAFPR